MLLTLEMTDALRPRELLALRWSSFDGSRPGDHGDRLQGKDSTIWKNGKEPWGGHSIGLSK